MPRNTSSVQFIDAKEHYESLISLFKTCLAIFTALITFIAAIAAYLMYGNAKDFKEDMKNQMEIIKESAEIQAKSEISKTFDKENLNKYIIEEAQKRIEPQIKDFTEKQIDFHSKQMVDQAIINLESSNPITQSVGFTSLIVAPQLIFNEKQVSKIISIAEGTKNDAPIRTSICALLSSKPPSPEITTFLKRELLKKNNTTQTYALTYLTQVGIEQDLNLYSKFSENDPDRLNLIINTARQMNNSELIKKLQGLAKPQSKQS